MDSGQVAGLFLVLMRCTGFVATAPILGHRAVPKPVKAGLAAILAITLASGASVAAGAMPVLLAAPIELLIGIAMGVTMNLSFAAIESASRQLSIQMGLSLGAVFDPVGGEASTPFDPLFAIMAALLFLALNLQLATIQVLADSFTSLPIGGGWPADLFGAVSTLIALALELAVRVAFPLALILLLVELAVALISRAIPQVNVFFLGLPLKILIGIVLVLIAAPTILAGMGNVFRFMIEGVNTALTVGAGATGLPTPLPSVVP
jgi:flagellar biosynthesis protein FliR